MQIFNKELTLNESSCYNMWNNWYSSRKEFTAINIENCYEVKTFNDATPDHCNGYLPMKVLPQWPVELFVLSSNNKYT